MGLEVKAQRGQVTWPRTHRAVRSACAARCSSQARTQKPAAPQRAAPGPQAGKGHFCSTSTSAEQRAPLTPAEACSPDPGEDCLHLSYPTRKGRSSATPKREKRCADGNEGFCPQHHRGASHLSGGGWRTKSDSVKESGAQLTVLLEAGPQPGHVVHTCVFWGKVHTFQETLLRLASKRSESPVYTGRGTALDIYQASLSLKGVFTPL